MCQFRKCMYHGRSGILIRGKDIAKAKGQPHNSAFWSSFVIFFKDFCCRMGEELMVLWSFGIEEGMEVAWQERVR